MQVLVYWNICCCQLRMQWGVQPPNILTCCGFGRRMGEATVWARADRHPGDGQESTECCPSHHCNLYLNCKSLPRSVKPSKRTEQCKRLDNRGNAACLRVRIGGGVSCMRCIYSTFYRIYELCSIWPRDDDHRRAVSPQSSSRQRLTQRAIHFALGKFIHFTQGKIVWEIQNFAEDQNFVFTNEENIGFCNLFPTLKMWYFTQLENCKL